MAFDTPKRGVPTLTASRARVETHWSVRKSHVKFALSPLATPWKPPHFLGHRGYRRQHLVQRNLLQLRRLVSALAYQKPVELLAAGQYGGVSQPEIIRDVH